jgi:hypothetical protein
MTLNCTTDFQEESEMTIQQMFKSLYNAGLVMSHDRNDEKRILHRWTLSQTVKQLSVKDVLGYSKGDDNGE